MSARGRPLRFLALVAVGWVGARAAMLWPTSESLPHAIERATLPPRLASPARPAPPPSPTARAVANPSARAADAEGADASSAPIAPPLPLPLPAARSDPRRVQLAMLGFLRYGSAVPAESNAAFGQLIAPLPPRGPAPPVDPWRASIWLLTRGGAAAPGLAQLGAGQAGIRVTRQIAGPFAASARLTSALDGRGRELALGGEVRLGRLPIAVTADYRFALDGGPGGPAVGVVGGVDQLPVAGPVLLEGYVQAGIVHRGRRAQRYADGAARMTVPLSTDGPIRIAIGAGAWGGAQPDAARLDIGPSAVARIALGGRDFRIALDGRARVAGRAAPNSGIALTIGADF